MLTKSISPNSLSTGTPKWKRLKPFLPTPQKQPDGPGRTPLDLRELINTIHYFIRMEQGRHLGVDVRQTGQESTQKASSQKRPTDYPIDGSVHPVPER